MCDDDSRLVIDDNEPANCSLSADNVADAAQKTANKGFSSVDLHKRRSPSSSSLSSTSSSSSSSSSSGSSPLNGQQQQQTADRNEKNEKQQQVRKRKKEEIKMAPRKTNENVKVEAESAANKKRKTERTPRATASKLCQTDDLHQQPLKPDTNVLLDITIVFSPGPNTLYFTTKWKGKSYHGVITDGLSPKNQFFALKRERAERLNGGKNASGAQNGQNPSLKRGKRTLNRGAVDRKGRTNPEEYSIFESPDLNDDNKATKLIKVADGEAQKMFTRCPHKNCGHIFETVNEVNQHLVFRHVNEPAVIKESTACQYSPVATTSTGCDPIPELLEKPLCAKCSEPIEKSRVLTKSTNDNQIKAADSKGQKTSQTASPSYSDISADDAPPLIKEESFEKNDELRQQTNAGLNFVANPMLIPKFGFQASNTATNSQSNAANSLTPRRPETSGTNKAASNSSTPAPSSSTPISNKQPKRTAITPNMNINQSQQPRLMPPPNFSVPFGQTNAQQQQQIINNQHLYTLMNMVNASGALQMSTAAAPTVKAGGSITAGSSSFSNLPPSSVNFPGSSIGPGGIGIVHPQQLGSLTANGLTGSNTLTSSSAASTADAMRHKIHELKTGDGTAANQSANLLGLNSISLHQQQQQQRNSSPNPAVTNVITSASSIQRGQQQLPFVRPPTTSITATPPFPFFQRLPGVMPPQQSFMNQQQMNQLFASMINGLPGQMMPQQPK